METTIKNYALVTGASSGIGFELARHCAANGYPLILVARDEERLQQIAAELRDIFNKEVIVIAKDLFKPGAAKEIYDATTAQGLIVDALINDAGQGQWGNFINTDPDREIDMIHLNIIALMSLTKYYARDMVTRGHGRILQLASSLAKTPTPLMAVYAATKAFVLSFSEALAEELKDTGVTVTALQPYASDTDFFHKAQSEMADIYRTGNLSDPLEVARAGFDGMEEGSITVVPGFINKMQAALGLVTPDAKLTANLHDMMKPNTDPKGRTHATHKPSAEARRRINSQTGGHNGDLPSHRGHVHEAGNEKTDR